MEKNCDNAHISDTYLDFSVGIFFQITYIKTNA